MTVVLTTLQRHLPLDAALLHAQVTLAKRLLTRASPAPCTASLTLTSNAHVRRLNLRYALRAKLTDVLSFRLSDGAPAPAPPRAGAGAAPYLDPATGALLRAPPAHAHAPRHLGDVFLAVPYCRRVAARDRVRPHQYALLAAVHGLAHLAGHGHRTRAETARMREAELRALDALRETYGYVDDRARAERTGRPYLPAAYLPRQANNLTEA